MKAILINLAIILILITMYYLDFWSLFSFKNSFWFAIVAVASVLLIGLKVIGNPFGRGNDND